MRWPMTMVLAGDWWHGDGDVHRPRRDDYWAIFSGEDGNDGVGDVDQTKRRDAAEQQEEPPPPPPPSAAATTATAAGGERGSGVAGDVVLSGDGAGDRLQRPRDDELQRSGYGPPDPQGGLLPRR